MRKILLCVLALAVLLCCSCSSGEPESASRAFFAMDTYMQITVYGSGAYAASFILSFTTLASRAINSPLVGFSSGIATRQPKARAISPTFLPIFP